MSGTSDLCLPPIIYVWHQCWKSDRNIQGEMVLCKINRARLISCLAPMQEALKIISTLVANYVWHQLFMSGTNAASLAPMQEALEIISVLVANYVWHQLFMSGTSTKKSINLFCRDFSSLCGLGTHQLFRQEFLLPHLHRQEQLNRLPKWQSALSRCLCRDFLRRCR